MRKINVNETIKHHRDDASDTGKVNQVKKEMALPRIVSSLRNKTSARRTK